MTVEIWIQIWIFDRWKFFNFIFQNAWPAANFDAHSSTTASFTVNLHAHMFRLLTKLSLSWCYFKSFVSFVCCMLRILLQIHLIHTLTCISPKSGSRAPKIAFTTVKTVLTATLYPRNTLFRVCVQMFDKNLMLNLHPILLHNHLININTWKTAKSGGQTAESSPTMTTLTTVQNAMHFGQIVKRCFCQNYS